MCVGLFSNIHNLTVRAGSSVSVETPSGLVHLGNTAEQNRHTQDKGLSKEEVSNTQIYEPDIDRKVNKHRDMTDCGNKINYRGRQTM